jgi:hypothetical protein
VNDRQDPYGQNAQNAQIYGYDEYGRPLYRPASPDGYDYGTGQQPPVPPAPPAPPVPPGSYEGYDYGGYDYGTAQQPAFGTYDHGTGQQPPVAPAGPVPPAAPGYDQGTGEQAPVSAPVPGQRRPPDGDAYHTEQFAFVDDPNDASEDVIDWLKFTESRTERREEAKRRGKVRRRLLVFTLVLAVLGGTGYLWATDRLPAIPGLETTEETTTEAEVRDVIVVHLRETSGDTTSTALLVANETTEQGTTLLLPNELAVTPDGGTTTLGQAVAESSAGEVRDAVGGLLGADIAGTWRLDTPYLELLVNVVGGITLDTNAEVAGEEEGDDPLVPRGEDVALDGQAAVAYAVHRAEEEPETAQLERFGQVMAAVLDVLPPGRDGAGEVVNSLGQIADPSLPEDELSASLAQLAGFAQSDAHDTTLLPVRDDGTLSEETSDGLVRDVLGGTVQNADPGGAVRIGIRDASGAEGAAEDARIDLVNGGFTVVDARSAEETQAESAVTYGDEAARTTAEEAARTLGLPDDAVSRGEGAGNADVTIVLGEDYEQ